MEARYAAHPGGVRFDDWGSRRSKPEPRLPRPVCRSFVNDNHRNGLRPRIFHNGGLRLLAGLLWFGCCVHNGCWRLGWGRGIRYDLLRSYQRRGHGEQHDGDKTNGDFRPPRNAKVGRGPHDHRDSPFNVALGADAAGVGRQARRRNEADRFDQHLGIRAASVGPAGDDPRIAGALFGSPNFSSDEPRDRQPPVEPQ